MRNCPTCEVLKEEIRYLRSLLEKLHDKLGVQTIEPVDTGRPLMPERPIEQKDEAVTIPYGDPD